MRVRLAFLSFLMALGGCSRPGANPPTDATTAAGPAPPEVVNPPEEVARLRGAWAGTVLAGDAPSEVTVEFTAREVSIVRNGATRTRPYAIDPTKDPKWIDLEGSIQSDPPQPTVLGIYELDGDRLRISLGTPVTRPTAFGGEGVVTAVYLLTRK